MPASTFLEQSYVHELFWKDKPQFKGVHVIGLQDPLTGRGYPFGDAGINPLTGKNTTEIVDNSFFISAGANQAFETLNRIVELGTYDPEVRKNIVAAIRIAQEQFVLDADVKRPVDKETKKTKQSNIAVKKSATTKKKAKV